MFLPHSLPVRHTSWVTFFLMCCLGASTAAHGEDITPAQWLASQPKPAFKAGHTLPRLTRYAYQVPIDVTKELTENWGYALQLHEGYLDQQVVDRLDDPSSREAQIAALTLSDPVKYPLFITTSRRMPGVGEVDDSAWTHNASGQLLTGSLSSPDGTPWSPGEEPLYSSEAPDSVWALAGEYRAAPLRALVARVPVNMVLNGGEYGMGFVGVGDGAGTIWGLDPSHNAAVASSIWGGGRNGHCSAKSANAQRIIADAIRAAAPQRSLYVFYTAGGRTLRNHYWGQDFYGGYWEHGSGINDIPSNETYYKSFNSGFTGGEDVLTMALNAASLEIASGNPLSYNWLTGGWERGDPATFQADITRWTGFLKCYATAGMIGGNLGAYGDNNATLSASFPSNAPSYYLRDLIALSHVQALFSQIESLLRNSDLLPGPMKHAISITEPAYEFPTGDATARVLARKHRTQATWLITAWAADGADRHVRVAIPELGQLTVEARSCGSVYTATLTNHQVTLIRLDNEGATYTAVADGTPVVTTVDSTTQLPPASDCLLWLDAGRGLTVDGTGKVSAWTSQGSVALTLEQSLATNQPTVVTNAITGFPAVRFSNNLSWLENNAIGDTAGNAFIGTLNVYAVFTGATINGDNRVISATANGGDWETGKGFKLTDGIVGTAELKNGVLLKVTGGQIETTLNAIRIGVMGPGYGGFSGDLAEILVYKGQSQQSSSLVTAYLKDKYNLRPSTVVNGSFEAYQVSGYQYCQYTPQTPGWINCGSIVQANGSPWGAPIAPDGTQTAVLQMLGNMSQTIDLAAGSYTVGFKAARRQGQLQPVKVSIDGTQIALISPSSDAFDDYVTDSFTVTAGFHTLRLEGTDGTGDKSTFIDQVSLTKLAGSTGLLGGSFEVPMVNGYQYSPTGSSWTFSASSVIQANGSAWGALNAPDGKQTAVLQNTGAISQTITLAAGSYRIGFKAARRDNQIQPVKVSVDGTQIGSLISPASAAFEAYTSGVYTVAAGEHTVRLEGTDGTDDKSTFIDDVQINGETGAGSSATTAGLGSITREWWTGIGGTALNSVNWTSVPSGSESITSFEGPTNWADDYGSRIRGYLVAPTSGTYTFWVATDDDGELWLSTTDQPADKVMIASVAGWTNNREWNKYASQKSATIALMAGQQYYIEVLHKEGSGGDNVAVGWAKPGEGTSEPSQVIPGTQLSPWIGGSASMEGDLSDPACTGNICRKTLLQTFGLGYGFGEAK